MISKITLKQLIRDINREEWRFILFFSAIIIGISSLPYLVLYFDAPSGHIYDGLTFIGTGDFNIYFSYIDQIKDGAFLLRDNFTAEANQAGLFNIFWLAVGWWARLFNLPAALAYHLARLVLIPVAFSLFYLLFSYFFAEKKWRKWALIFSGCSAGWGGLMAFIAHGGFSWWGAGTPVDLWVPEANIFFSLLLNPHFILSYGLMALFFLFLLLAWENDNWHYSLSAGFVGLVWFNFHPYYAPYVFAITLVFLLYLLIRHKKIKLISHYLIALAISLPSVFYHYYLIRTDLVIGVRASQNITLSPPFFYVAAGFGFLLVGGFLGIYYLAKNFKVLPDKFAFLLIWLAIGFNLLYLPISFNRRFTEGLQIPLLLLTVYGLVNLAAVLKNKGRIWHKIFSSQGLAYFLFIVFFCTSGMYVILRDVCLADDYHDFYYLPAGYVQAANWLKINNSQHRVVLGQQMSGNFLAGIASQKVYLGHGHETIFFTAKMAKLQDFFNGQYSDSQARDFLAANNIGYLFYSQLEKNTLKIKPEVEPYLREVFANQEVKIFSVINN